MSFIKKIVHFALFVIAGLNAAAQNTNENGNYSLRTVIAPSATTASLGKFGEIPVSLYTGIPNISIPLYDIKDGGLNVPIALSYHAGGIRVEEIASSVGIGWALNAGGMIGRQVRGMPDEIGGWVSANISERISTKLKSSDQSISNSASISLEKGFTDGEPDIYYYNFNGKSGKFLLDEAGNIEGYPVTGVKIQPLDYPYFSSSGWKITTEDGTVYLFNKSETADTDDQGPVITAWYLSEMTSPDGANKIAFTYEPVDYTNTLYYGETKYFLTASTLGSGLNDIESTGKTQWTHTQRLTRISFSDGYVRLNYNNQRQDIANNMDKSLDQIEIYNIKNQLIKKFDFAYSYFGEGGGGLYLERRLKLTSVTEKSLSQSHPPYIFTYNEAVQTLSRNTLSKDHWGYFNGKGNGSLIPQFKAYDFGGSFGQYNAGGADRNTDTVNAKAFMLQKITYPTGGETEFAFESNTSADPVLDFTNTTTTNYGFSRNQEYSSVPSPYEEPEFTIPASGAEVKMTISGLATSALGCDNFQAYILRNGEIWAGPLVDSYNFHLNMPGGNYKLHFVFTCVPNFTFNYQAGLEVKIPNAATSGKKPVGGMRVRQVISRPGGGGQPVIKKYKYQDVTIPGNSSGILVNFPTYGYGLQATKYQYSTAAMGCVLQGVYSYVAAQGTTNYPLATTQGSFVGYGYVVEDLGEMGEIRHTYNAFSPRRRSCRPQRFHRVIYQSSFP